MRNIYASNRGFTIVELLIVVVVIAILAAIVIASYNGITRSASISALKSELSTATTQLGLYQVEQGAYPANGSLSNAGVSNSTDVSYEYTSSISAYCLTATSLRAQTSYYFDSTEGVIAEGVCSGHTGYVEGGTLTYSDVAVGGLHTIVLLSNNKMYAWGDNTSGQLGDGTANNSSVPREVVVTGTPLENKTIVQVEAGYASSYALTSDGLVYSWGENATGQLGDGSSTNRLFPVAVATTGTPMEGKTIESISTSNAFVLALSSDGFVYAWGENSNGSDGALGNNTIADSDLPVSVLTAGTSMQGKQIVEVVAGAYQGYARASDNSLYAWGYGEDGALGDGLGVTSLVPVSVVTAGTPMAGKNIIDIDGAGNNAIALASDGSVYVWGFSYLGAIGDGSVDISVLLPRSVAVAGTPMADKQITQIAASGGSFYALSASNELYSWGQNWDGELGDGTTDQKNAPVSVLVVGTSLADKTISRVYSGGNHAIILATDGSLHGFGLNESGQIGDGTFVSTATAKAITLP